VDAVFRPKMRQRKYEHFQEKWMPVFRPKMRQRKYEHFQEKWMPVFRPKMRQREDGRAVYEKPLYSY